ncbi:MAG TPA: hypothetical protein VIJ68_04005 [Candidatus Saccharimonadales bacterium]
MIEHAPPPTEPKPAPEVAPGLPNPDVLQIDHSRPAAHQVHEFIAAQGRTGNGDLTWERPNSDGGTTRYVTRMGLERQQLTDPGTGTGEPAVHIEKQGLPWRRREGRVLELYRERVATALTAQVPTTYIEVYENDQLVDVQKKNNAEFNRFLNREGEEIGQFWLQEEQKTAPPDKDIKIDVTSAANREKSVVGLIQGTQKEIAAPDWQGLTYHDGRSGENVTILKDVVGSRRTMDGWATERYFIKQIWDKKGNIRQERELANITKATLEKLPRDELNPRFRVVEADLKRRETARDLGEMALAYRATMTHEQKRGMELQPDAAIDLLAGIDFYEGDAFKRQKARINKDKRTPLYAEELCNMAAELGTDNLLDLATRMKDNYLRATKQIGFDKIGLPGEDDTLAWILWDMAEQHYYSTHPNEAKGKLRGIETGSIIGYYSENIAKQEELIDARVGKNIEKVGVIIKDTGEHEKVVMLGSDGLPKEVPNPGRPILHVEPNDKLVRDLTISSKAKSKLDAVLERAKPRDTDLSYHDHAEIGAIMREAFTR